VNKSYYREHVLDIVNNEDLDSDILIDILNLILESVVLDRSTEDLEYRISIEAKNEVVND
jgi:hypothetical protein